jgi:hypothetical protein
MFNDFKYDLFRATESFIVKTFLPPKDYEPVRRYQAMCLKVRASEVDVSNNDDPRGILHR